MLGQGCLKAFLTKQFPPHLKWVKVFFANGLKSVRMWAKTVSGPDYPTWHPKTHLWTDFGTLTNPNLQPTIKGYKFSRTHPSLDAIFSAKSANKWPEIITSHDVLESSKQTFLLSRDVLTSSQSCVLNCKGGFSIW